MCATAPNTQYKQIITIFRNATDEGVREAESAYGIIITQEMRLSIQAKNRFVVLNNKINNKPKKRDLNFLYNSL